MMPTITRNLNQQRAADAAQRLTSRTLKVPVWQRAGDCWTVARQQLLIDSILKSYATPEILIRVDENGQCWLEDGFQRLTAISEFIAGNYACGKESLYEGKKYAELPPEVRRRFDDYMIPTQNYRGATEKEAIEQFIRRQDGVALTTGEKEHALSSTSPVVKLAKELLLTPGVGFHDSAKAVWGTRSGADKRRRALENAVALVAGACMGAVYVTVNWEKLKQPLPGGGSVLTREMDREKAEYVIGKLIEVYELANEESAENGKKVLNTQWLRGNFSGYMVHTFTATPQDQHDDLVSGWAMFIADHRQEKLGPSGKPLLKELTKHAKWADGHAFLITLGYFPDSAATAAVADDEVDEDELNEDNE